MQTTQSIARPKQTQSLPLVILWALSALVLSSFGAAAATFTVTNANDSGPGSLRDAINQANSNAQEDTINFDPTFFNVARTITLTSGEIAISSDGANPGRLVTINGPGASLLTISGNNASRIFLLGPGFNANVTISGMTLRDGNGLSDLYDSGNGGAIYAVVAANLTLKSMVIRNNVVTAVAKGGGIYLNTSDIVINDSLITANSAYNVGGIYSGNENRTFTMRNTIVSNNRSTPGDVGGISIYRGAVDIKNCQITGNIAARSIGGMDVYQARMDISDTVISGNDGTAAGAGGINMENTSVVNLRRVTIAGNLNGGMYVRNVGEAVNIIDSTISNNSVRDVAGFSGEAGGGLSIGGESSSPTRIINSTISGNSAPDHGGGIYNFSNGLELINSTVVNNSVTNTGGNRGGGGIYDGELQRSGGNSFGFRFKLQNSIIAGNTASPGPDVFSGFDSAGYNIIGNTANTNNSTAASGDQFKVDPKVGPLADNGGPTKTHALLPGSPAIDKGKSAEVTTDQRGFARPFEDPAVANAPGGDGSDIGALEAGAASQPLNISTRLRVLTGDKALIGGFIVTGTEPKRVLIRSIGPSLGKAGVAGALQDTTLELFKGSVSIAFNDNWRDTQETEITETTIPPDSNLESAIVRTLEPGGYTAIVRGKDNTTGIALVEAYDLARGARSKLANISSRGFVDTNDNALIGGFIVGGNNTRVVLRAIGPSLAPVGIADPLRDPLQDPTLQLIDSNGAIVRQNDNWRSDQEAEIRATGIPPQNDSESALVETLSLGNYTAVVRGAGGTTGVGVVEIYNIQ